MSKRAETLTLALCIALLPPIWAVAAPYVGVTTGAVALICAGLCAANVDKAADAPRISAGFLLGDFWGLAGPGHHGPAALEPRPGTVCHPVYAALDWGCSPGGSSAPPGSAAGPSA